MLNFNSILVSSEHPKELADFYQKVFQKEPDMNEGGYTGFLVGKGFLTIGPHDKVFGKSADPERILINFEISDVKGEFERIKALGAEVIAQPYQMGKEHQAWIATFADPDGNFFQLLTPWEEMKKD